MAQLTSQCINTICRWQFKRCTFPSKIKGNEFHGLAHYLDSARGLRRGVREEKGGRRTLRKACGHKGRQRREEHGVDAKRRQLAGNGFLPRCLASPPQRERVRRVETGPCAPAFSYEAWPAQRWVLSKAPPGRRGEGATSQGPALAAALHPAGARALERRTRASGERRALLPKLH